jgi:hypothetical protein
LLATPLSMVGAAALAGAPDRAPPSLLHAVSNAASMTKSRIVLSRHHIIFSKDKRTGIPKYVTAKWMVNKECSIAHTAFAVF